MTPWHWLKESLIGGPSWEESALAYSLQNWRCWLGHKWSEEQSEVELGVTISCWIGCERKNCGQIRETYHWTESHPRQEETT